MVSVAIIGCGMAGVSLARLLTTTSPGVKVSLFDKGRGMGGRMATRYSTEFEHDHGAQFFTVRDEAFETFLASYKSAFETWDARVTTLSPGSRPYKRPWFEPHFVSSPRMNSLCKQIADGFDIHLGQRVTNVTGGPGNWFLESDATLSGPFDWVVSTAPRPQTTELLDLSLPEASYEPVFAMMTPLARLPSFDAAVVRESPIAWVAVTSSKTGRRGDLPPGLVVHADPHWSARHLETPREEVKHQLLDALGQLSLQATDHDQAMLHLWRYGRVSESASEPFALDPDRQLAACGDWCVGNTVEAAFLSSLALSASLNLS